MTASTLAYLDFFNFLDVEKEKIDMKNIIIILLVTLFFSGFSTAIVKDAAIRRGNQEADRAINFSLKDRAGKIHTILYEPSPIIH